MNNKTVLPGSLQTLADKLVGECLAGNSHPEGIEAIYEWLEIDGWDDLISDLGDEMALKLYYLADLEFNDNETRWNLDIPDDQEVQDSDRLNWARQRIDYFQTGDDGYVFVSVHAYPLVSSDGKIAIVGCLVEIHGQAGPVCDWWGLWKSREDFYDALGSDGQIWLSPRMGEIPDDVILSMWAKPAKKKQAKMKKSQS
jgi:hypothetical protein